MRTARSIALAAVVATIPACSEGGAPCDAEFGPWGEMPDLDMLIGDTVETPIEDYFSPVDCLEGYFARYGDSLFAAGSADPAVAVSVSGAVLTIAALDVADSARVEVGLAPWWYIEDEELPHEFLVRVRPHPAGR